MTNYIKALILVTVACGLNAQEIGSQNEAFLPELSDSLNSIPRIFLNTVYRQDGVKLRWAPSTHKAWETCNVKGYNLYREDDSGNTILIDSIFPFDKASFEAQYQKTGDEAILGAAGCIFFESENVDYHSGSWVERAIFKENVWSAALSFADRSFSAAQALGLAYLDTEIDEDNRYVYHIYPRLDTTVEVGIGLGSSSQYTTVFDTMPVPRLAELSEEEGAVHLLWTRDYHSEHFSYYFVERSEDGYNYKRLNETPYVHAYDRNANLVTKANIYVDSVANYQKYWYRLVGITPFGELSEPSNVLKGMGRDRTAPELPSITKVKFNETDSSIVVSWTQSLQQEKVAGYLIKRSHSIDGPYDYLFDRYLLGDERSFADTDPDPYQRNFYTIGAIDSSGNIAYTAPVMGLVPDKTPPAIPTKLSGTVSQDGVISIEWGENVEPDFWGYHVYFANDTLSGFTRITRFPVKTNSYSDTISLKSLSSHVYYRLSSIDTRSNVSKYSDYIRFSRPDTIPPIEPVFKSYKVDSSYISIDIVPSLSPDVVKHNLYRKEGKEYDLIQSFTNKPGRLLDKSIEPNIRYTYKLEAIDYSGNRSSSPSILTVKSRAQLPDLKPVILQVQAKEKNTIISWAQVPGAKSYILYRTLKSDHLVRYKSVRKGLELEVKSSDLENIKGLYLQAVLKDNENSLLSDIYKIN